MKLVVKGANSDTWVVSGFVVGGKDSKMPTAASQRAKWLRMHLTSCAFDKAKLNEAPLKMACQDRDKRTADNWKAERSGAKRPGCSRFAPSWSSACCQPAHFVR